MDALSIVVDEVALEGLDGITLPSLWIRLEDREPKFPLKLDNCTKGFIWRSLVNNADLSFHELPEEREDIELFDRFKDIDPETGFETQKQKFSHDRRDVYPLHVIPENQDGIQGSCVFFKERKNVTKQIRSKSFAPLVNLEEAQERYGRKLVVVASQALRFRTLIGSNNDPESKISNDSYCVLERVGRGRWQGELQSDLHGSLFKIDARKMHYLRKCLVKHDLITMQSYVRRLKTGQQQHSILLLLKRFHVNRSVWFRFCFSAYLVNSYKFSNFRHNKIPAEDFTSITTRSIKQGLLSSGTKGVPHREIGLRMNVGRLESRMICRKMDRDGVIKVNVVVYFTLKFVFMLRAKPVLFQSNLTSS
uniref:Uncharacterized protein n=1 Tax=Poecilia mexicana TaxID=48701 RepID=A0A3B3WU31_9TELE